MQLPPDLCEALDAMPSELVGVVSRIESPFQMFVIAYHLQAGRVSMAAIAAVLDPAQYAVGDAAMAVAFDAGKAARRNEV